MLYGATGSLDISTVFQGHCQRQSRHQVLVFGLVFIVAGLAFKLGVVPFHMWIPDVYQGAPTAVTLDDWRCAQAGGFCHRPCDCWWRACRPLAIDWQQMMMVLAVGSLLIGNFAAIAQTNVKRMLAFSTISQMGFGAAWASMSGRGQWRHRHLPPMRTARPCSIVVTYVLTTLASFRCHLLPPSREGFESEEIADFRRPEPAQPVVCRRHGPVACSLGWYSAHGGFLCQALGAGGARSPPAAPCHLGAGRLCGADVAWSVLSITCAWSRSCTSTHPPSLPRCQPLPTCAWCCATNGALVPCWPGHGARWLDGGVRAVRSPDAGHLRLSPWPRLTPGWSRPKPPGK